MGHSIIIPLFKKIFKTFTQYCNLHVNLKHLEVCTPPCDDHENNPRRIFLYEIKNIQVLRNTTVLMYLTSM
jgi:hypothetical protein